jgi:hypothetical protein
MCHFYANPLSILLAIPYIDPEILHKYLTTTHLDAIRSLRSMRKYVEAKRSENDIEEVKAILLDDAYLISLLPQFVDHLEMKSQELRESVIVLAKLCERGVKMKPSPPSSLAELYLSVLTGEITQDSPLVKELLQLQK